MERGDKVAGIHLNVTFLPWSNHFKTASVKYVICDNICDTTEFNHELLQYTLRYQICQMSLKDVSDNVYSFCNWLCMLKRLLQRIHRCFLTYSSFSMPPLLFLLSPPRAFFAMRNLSKYFAKINFQVTGRKTDERGGKQAQIKWRLFLAKEGGRTDKFWMDAKRVILWCVCCCCCCSFHCKRCKSKRLYWVVEFLIKTLDFLPNSRQINREKTRQVD